jgi:SAM-dependent methyltransferase
MSKPFSCYICNSDMVEEIFSIKDYPAYIVPLPLSIAPNVRKGDIGLSLCSKCGHMQVPNPDAALQDLIYGEYYNYYVVDSSEALVPHYRTPFINFINRLVDDKKLSKGDLLEIGCSSGEKVDFFASLAKSYTGIDPSDKIKLAIKRYPNHQFIQGFFPEATSNAKFDIIVSQFNLEHIANVGDFIDNIHKAANPNGILLIQVPDCEHFLRTNQPNFLAHEHIQYFVKDTLNALLEPHGFSPIAWGEDGPSLITAAIKSEQKDFDFKNAEKVKKNAKAQSKLFYNFPVLSDSSTIFYGVGPQLYWLLNQFKGDMDKLIVVDDNKEYHGKGLPGYSFQVMPFSKDLLNDRKIVLSLNKIYHEKVLKKIQSIKDQEVDVTYLKNENWVTEKI